MASPTINFNVFLEKEKLKNNPLEEEGDSHKGEWRGSDITESDLNEMLAEGYLPTTEGLVWWAAQASEVIPSPQSGEKVYLKDQLVCAVSFPISELFIEVLSYYRVQPRN